MGRRAIIGLLMLAATGCGGGDQRHSAGSSGRPPDRNFAAFVASADRLCAWAQRGSARLARRDPATIHELVGYARRTGGLVRESERRLGRLRVPARAGARVKAERFIRSVRALGPYGRSLDRWAGRLEAALGAHSPNRARTAVLGLEGAFIGLERADDRSTRVAKRNGFHDCAKRGRRDRPPPASDPGGVQASA